MKNENKNKKLCDFLKINIEGMNREDFINIFSAIRGPDFHDNDILKATLTKRLRCLLFGFNIFYTNYLEINKKRINEIIQFIEKNSKNEYSLYHYLTHLHDAFKALQKYVNEDDKMICEFFIQFISLLLDYLTYYNYNDKKSCKTIKREIIELYERYRKIVSQRN